MSSNLNESLHKLTGDDSFIADTEYSVRDLILNKPKAYRIVYDSNIDLYIIGDASNYVHNQLVRIAFEQGYYLDAENNESLPEEAREYIHDGNRRGKRVSDTDIAGYRDYGDGCYGDEESILDMVWMPNGTKANDVNNAPQYDSYEEDDCIEFVDGVMWCRYNPHCLVNGCPLLDILPKKKNESLIEDYLNQDKSAYITDSEYTVKQYIQNAKQAVRVYYDDLVNMYMYGDAYDFVHIDFIEMAIQGKYYPSEVHWTDDVSGKAKSIFMVVVPEYGDDYHSLKSQREDIASDSYDTEYVYPEFRIYTREDDDENGWTYGSFQDCDLYNILENSLIEVNNILEEI